VKSEVPVADEPVGRLEGIGEQAVSTLRTLGQQLGHATGLPIHLGVVEKVGLKTRKQEKTTNKST
jgi:hypothetical protein